MTHGTHLTRLRRILLTGSALILHHMAQVGDAFEQDASLCGGGDAALLQDAGERRVRQGGEQPSRVRRRRRCVRLRCHLRSPPRTTRNGKRMRGAISLASRIYPHQCVHPHSCFGRGPVALISALDMNTSHLKRKSSSDRVPSAEDSASCWKEGSNRSYPSPPLACIRNAAEANAFAARCITCSRVCTPIRASLHIPKRPGVAYIHNVRRAMSDGVGAGTGEPSCSRSVGQLCLAVRTTLCRLSLVTSVSPCGSPRVHHICNRWRLPTSTAARAG